MNTDKKLFKKSIDWMLHADKYKYTYNYEWLEKFSQLLNFQMI